jgi:hypothetical protein
MRISRWLVGGLALGLVLGCSNVGQMQRKYEQGDAKQYNKIVEILARQDYPYATRKRAAAALGDIGDPRAVPILVGVLSHFDQRTTLKQEVLTALGKIGDTTAVAPISRLLDRSLQETNSELRMAAIPVLGQLGSSRAALVLIRALRLYDIQMLQQSSRVVKGMFSDEEQPQFNSPFARPDSTGRVRDRPGLSGVSGFPGEQNGPVNMFGLDPTAITRDAYNPTPEERRLTHDTLVNMGEKITQTIVFYLAEEDMTHTLKKELQTILDQIHQSGAAEGQAASENTQAAQ